MGVTRNRLLMLRRHKTRKCLCNRIYSKARRTNDEGVELDGIFFLLNLTSYSTKLRVISSGGGWDQVS